MKESFRKVPMSRASKDFHILLEEFKLLQSQDVMKQLSALFPLRLKEMIQWLQIR